MNERGRSKLSAGALLVWATMSLAACDVYDRNKLTPPTTGNPNDSGLDANAGPIDGGDAAVSCVPRDETCNRVDDDCDGTTDERAAATADCAKQRPHATNVSCDSSGVCFSSGCEAGFTQADGRPQNGCEPCEDMSCEDDAGTDDGGANDAG